MKKTKKIPKTLPKFAPGGTMNFNEGLYTTSNKSTDATKNIYNEKRSEGLSNSQYAQAGTAILGGGMQAFNAYSDPNSNSLQKTRGLTAGIDNAEVGVASAINPVLGTAVGAVKKIGNNVQTKVDRTNSNGDIINTNSSKAGEVVGGFLDPANSLMSIYSDPNATTGQKIAGALTGGISDMFTNRHKNQVESSAKADIASQQAQQSAYEQQQAAYQQQQNAFITNAIQSGMNKYQNQNSGMVQYAQGGINMTPNAEIESQENVVAPNGGFLQANGPTHENGGVPVALPGNSMIFSDRLKAPGSKKTFADLNKPNNTNKEDKILDSNKYGNISKHTAELMKLAKNKNSQALFNAQESLKQAKVQAYAKKMGITLPQESPEQGMQFPNGGTLPMYNIDPNPQYNINPNFNQLPKDTTYQGFNTNYNLAPQITPMPATNDSTVVKNRRVEYANGGMLPKYPWGNDGEDNQLGYVPRNNAEAYKMQLASQNRNSGLTPEQMQSIPIQNNIGILPQNMPVYNPSKYGQGQYDPKDLQLKGNPQIQEVPQFNNPYVKQKSNTDWSNIATNAAMGLANNAGNIYNLSRYNKPEVEFYERVKASYLDPTAAIRDANEQTRRAEYNVRGASGGNAGTYLSNRVGLNAQNIENKDRIRQQYANTNAQIGNQVNQFNTDIAMREVIANAQNRARNRSGKGEAIGSMGYNTANQIMDNKKGNMDQETLQLMMKYYNNPEFQKYMKESGFNKKSK